MLSGLRDQAQPTRLDKFKQAECDDDEARWEERVRKLVRHMPVEPKPE